MRYLLLLFVPIYLWHAYGEVSTWRSRQAPLWALIVMTISKVLLTLGMLAFVFVPTPPSLRDQAFRITSVCIYFEFYFALRSSPPKAVSIAGKFVDDAILIVLILLLSGTAGFFTRLLTTPPGRSILQILFILGIAYLVARFWPGSRRSVPEPVAAGDLPAIHLLKWILASPDFARVPDEIVLADQRTQIWPGHDEVPTSLYRVRFGDLWYVALAEPVCHCFAKPIGADVPIEKIYDDYKEWYADAVSKRLILKAAGDLGDKRFESLVKKALADKPSDNPDAETEKN